MNEKQKTIKMLGELKQWMLNNNCYLTASVDLLNKDELTIGIARLGKETIELNKTKIWRSSQNNDDCIIGSLGIERIEYILQESLKLEKKNNETN